MTDTVLEAGELHFTRVFDAPRDLVFRCMTEPRHLTHFWGPIGVSAPVDAIRVDARPGGVFETVMVNDADGSRYPTLAVYLDVMPPERLVWQESHSGMTVTIRFEDLGDARTEVHIHQTNVPAAFLAADVRAGFESALDRFATYLEALHNSETLS